MPQNRKTFLKNLSGGLFFSALPQSLTWGQKNISSTINETDLIDSTGDYDEKYWSHIAKKYYHTSHSFINLENGYFGVQPRPVFDSFKRNLAVVNTELARYARVDFPEIFLSIKKELAAFLDVSHDEIIITRNATEALNIAIQGYPFKQGDEVIMSQLDYTSMVETFKMLEQRGKIKIRSVELPLLPKTDEEIVDTYKKAINENTRVILLTHLSNINGLIIPVKKICALAKAKNIDTIVDSANALGQIDFNLSDLDSDFIGMNLHKWIGNPIGAGVLYIRKNRISEMQRLWGDIKKADNDIMKLAHFGTTQFAVILTIPESLAFHQRLGISRISQRLHYLKSIWVSEFAGHHSIEVVTPPDAQFSCAIASFRIKNKPASEVVDYLMKEHKIFTVSRDIGNDQCVRVTPSLYNSANDMKALITALNKMK